MKHVTNCSSSTVKTKQKRIYFYVLVYGNVS
jgi:hypothetical protein